MDKIGRLKISCFRKRGSSRRDAAYCRDHKKTKAHRYERKRKAESISIVSLSLSPLSLSVFLILRRSDHHYRGRRAFGMVTPRLHREEAAPREMRSTIARATVLFPWKMQQEIAETKAVFSLSLGLSYANRRTYTHTRARISRTPRRLDETTTTMRANAKHPGARAQTVDNLGRQDNLAVRRKLEEGRRVIWCHHHIASPWWNYA